MDQDRLFTKPDQPRACTRWCEGCRQWLHHSRFRRRRRGPAPHTTVWEFNSRCKACEQKVRNERKNEDRPLALMKQRAANRAHRLGVPFDYIWKNMNYRALVPLFRAMLAPDGLCLDCGHPFVNERDVQIEHHEPPRHDHDWAREHARNIGLRCGSCNRTKNNKEFAVYLDAQEDARLSNEQYRGDQPPPAHTEQLSLFAQ